MTSKYRPREEISENYRSMKFIAFFSTRIAAETFLYKLPVYLHLIYRLTIRTEVNSDIRFFHLVPNALKGVWELKSVSGQED